MNYWEISLKISVSESDLKLDYNDQKKEPHALGKIEETLNSLERAE